MRTLGIDFAAQPKNTALCEIVWDAGSATVTQVAGNVTDDMIREVVTAPPERIVGVDIPFGWPTLFVEFVAAHHAGARLATATSSRQLRLRKSDEFIWERFGKQPLSVSTDKIGVPTLRWAKLLSEFGVTNRAGDGRFFEVYPAAARLAWGLPAKDNAAALAMILEACRLDFTDPDLHAGVLRNEHAFDALLCALATRAAMSGLTIPPPADVMREARAEGWIHVPLPYTLGRLLGGSVVHLRADDI